MPLVVDELIVLLGPILASLLLSDPELLKPQVVALLALFRELLLDLANESLVLFGPALERFRCDVGEDLLQTAALVSGHLNEHLVGAAHLQQVVGIFLDLDRSLKLLRGLDWLDFDI